LGKDISFAFGIFISYIKTRSRDGAMGRGGDREKDGEWKLRWGDWAMGRGEERAWYVREEGIGIHYELWEVNGSG
jgi:hypothetical protein